MKYWDGLLSDIAEFLSLETLKSCIDEALGNLCWLTLLYSGALRR